MAKEKAGACDRMVDFAITVVGIAVYSSYDARIEGIVDARGGHQNVIPPRPSSFGLSFASSSIVGRVFLSFHARVEKL